MQKKIYFENLDSIRFIAALMVFFNHSMPFLFNRTSGDRVWRLMSDGYLGVCIFFVLSGFLITYILLEEKELTNHISIKKFYFRRILRIWPLYFLVLLISFGIFPFIFHLTEMTSSAASRLPYYLTFLSNFDMMHSYKYPELAHTNADVLLMQGVTWSVSVEEQFYLVWPLLFFLIKPRYYIFIFIFVIIASLLFRIYHNNDEFIFVYHTFIVMIYLAMGGLSAYLVKKYRSFTEFFSRIPPWLSLLIYFSGFVVLLYRNELMIHVPYTRAVFGLFYGIFFSFIILDQNYSPPSFLKLGRYKFLSFWGKCSYSIYLLHPIVICVGAYFIKPLNIEMNFYKLLLIGLCMLIVTLAISYCSYEFYEKRFLVLKKKFSVIVEE